MPTIISIDPVTRLEGHLKIEVTVDNVSGVQQVVDAHARRARCSAASRRSSMNRDPLDAPHITQRSAASARSRTAWPPSTAWTAAAGRHRPDNARIMRNLVLGANFMQSHILHFYHLAAADYIDGPDMAPWQPSWNADKRSTRRRRPDAGEPLRRRPWTCGARRTRWARSSAAGCRIRPAFVPGRLHHARRGADRITQFQAVPQRADRRSSTTSICPTSRPSRATTADYCHDRQGPRATCWPTASST